MRSEAPALLPIFRSRGQARLLTLLFLHPDQEYTLSDMARRLEMSLSTVHGEVTRLEDAELVTSRPVGRARLLRANQDNRLTAPLTHLLTLTFGPQETVGEEFGGLDAQAVLIFGSWARRYKGEPGPPPNDVDVLVLGDTDLEVDRGAVYEAAERAQARLDLPVNPVVRPAARWTSDDPLISQIKESPYVIAYGQLPE